MRILISGSSGLIGSHLVEFLSGSGHQIVRLKRKSSNNGSHQNSIEIDFRNKIYELSDFENFDTVIHLSGENIVGRWTEEKKAALVNSRIDTTNLLVDIFKNVNNPPDNFICASAIGIYGDTDDITVDENSDNGVGFLPELAVDWENAASGAKEFNARTVFLRIGLVLSKNGGALSKMLLPFKLGLGGNVGSGNQYWSWISINDIVSSVGYILENDSIEGPVNLVSPNSCTNSYFTKTLAAVLNRPAFFHVPEFMIKILFGQMGEQALLAGSRVKPSILLENGYEFIDTDLKETLEKLLNK